MWSFSWLFRVSGLSIGVSVIWLVFMGVLASGVSIVAGGSSVSASTSISSGLYLAFVDHDDVEPPQESLIPSLF